MVTAHIIHAFLGFTSTRLGSEVSHPGTLPRKNPEDLVRLEPRIPGLRVKHFTTEPRGTLSPWWNSTQGHSLKPDFCFWKSKKHCGKRRKCWLPAFSHFPTMFSKGSFSRVFKSRDCVAKS